jgi:hypothetical protein
MADVGMSAGRLPVTSKWLTPHLSSGRSVQNARRLEIACHWPLLLAGHQERHPHAAASPGLPDLIRRWQCMRHTGGIGLYAGRRLSS